MPNPTTYYADLAALAAETVASNRQRATARGDDGGAACWHQRANWPLHAVWRVTPCSRCGRGLGVPDGIEPICNQCCTICAVRAYCFHPEDQLQSSVGRLGGTLALITVCNYCLERWTLPIEPKEMRP